MSPLHRLVGYCSTCRTVLEGVDFNDLWNERESLKAEVASLRARLADLEAMRERAEEMARCSDYTVSGWVHVGRRVREAARYILGLTGTPAADAPHETTKREE